MNTCRLHLFHLWFQQMDVYKKIPEPNTANMWPTFEFQWTKIYWFIFTTGIGSVIFDFDSHSNISCAQSMIKNLMLNPLHIFPSENGIRYELQNWSNMWPTSEFQWTKIDFFILFYNRYYLILTRMQPSNIISSCALHSLW